MEMGRAEGYQQSEQSIISRLIEKRFGPVPAWVQEKLGPMQPHDIERIALRLLDVHSLEELLS
jgi:hypothetical protein